jgi:hypothetical protein
MLMRTAIQLLALIALMIMPLGMATAPAAAVHHEAMSAAIPMGHCPDQDSSRHSTGALADCTMACAAALPATDLAALDSHPIVKFAPQPALIAALSGIELEIATPPPRPS